MARTSNRRVVENNFASREAADEVSEEWSDAVLQCRSGLTRHDFRPYTAVHNKKLKYWHVVLRCPRCTTRKWYDMTDFGLVLHQGYNYPPGYLTKGVGRIVGEAADVVRIKAVQRLFEKTELTTQEIREDQPRTKTMESLTSGTVEPRRRS